jgi:hypothetical protein
MYGSMPADVPAGTARSSPARMRLKGPFAPTGIWHELNDAEGGRGAVRHRSHIRRYQEGEPRRKTPPVVTAARPMSAAALGISQLGTSSPAAFLNTRQAAQCLRNVPGAYCQRNIHPGQTVALAGGRADGRIQ